MSTNKKYILIMNAVSYIAVIVVNALATLGMLGSLTTQEISNNYLNLFTPGGYVFMIWSIIYLLLGAYIVYQFIAKDKTTVYMLAPFVFMTNLLNILWLFCWHFVSPLISLIVILLLLLFLFMIVRKLKFEHLLPKTTFTIYYAWITVASLASIFTFLVSLNGVIYNSLMMVILTDIALAIVGLLMVVVGRKSLVYLLTLLWATVGIFVNHLTVFEGSYLSILIVSVVVVLIGVTEVIVLVTQKK